MTLAAERMIDAYQSVAVTDDVTVADLIRHVAAQHPDLLRCLAPERLSPTGLRNHFLRLDEESGMFEGGHRGGRGDGYRAGQSARGVRKTAVRAIADIIGPERPVVADVLAGNGTLARTFAMLGLDASHRVLCCDIAADMVASGYRAGLATWRQGADRMLLADSCADAVTFLYGTHHIPRHRMRAAIQEAHRVLRPGGRILLQDFEEGSPSARWFSVVLQEWTPQGHDFAHFVPGEFATLLSEGGFQQIEEHRLYDPLELPGPTPEEALEALYGYVATTWELDAVVSRPDGRALLRDLVETYGRCDRDTWNHCELTRPGVLARGAACEAVMPRMSLVAWGTKDADR
jgi:ubiquinone/menaquinone biosynthesis C-methylase UbiE